MKKVLLSLCLLISSLCHAQPRADETQCKQKFPLASPIREITIEGGGIEIISGKTGTNARFVLRNRSGLSILEYAVEVETYDSEGGRLYGLTFHQSSSKGSSSPFWMPPVYKLESKIAPNKDFTAVGQAASVTDYCVSKAVLSYVYLKLFDGKVVEYATPGWRTDPGIAVPTDHLVLSGCSEEPGLVVLADLALDSRGSLIDLDVQSPRSSEQITSCLRRELSYWEFLPATIDGHEVDSKLPIMIMFNPSEKQLNERHKYSQQELTGANILVLRPNPLGGKNYWDFGYCCMAGTKSHP